MVHFCQCILSQQKNGQRVVSQQLDRFNNDLMAGSNETIIKFSDVIIAIAIKRTATKKDTKSKTH